MKTNDRIADDFAPLWNDVAENSNFPESRPLLAHYTTISTLEQILRNDQLWFSNPLYMNDIEELRIGVSESANAIRLDKNLENACGTEERHGLFLDAFEYHLQYFGQVHSFDTYVFSLSEYDVEDVHGKLSMWRGYGANGNGAAIVFDTSKLIAVEDSPIIVSKVEYMTKQNRLKWIHEKIAQFVLLMKNNFVPDEGLGFLAALLLQRIIIFSIFTKHSGFSEEKEWRAVYMRSRDHKELLVNMLHYHVTESGIEPKLKYKIGAMKASIGDEVSLEELIHKILLGPSISGPYAIDTVHRMLEIINKKKLFGKVFASEIPYRPMR